VHEVAVTTTLALSLFKLLAYSLSEVSHRRELDKKGTTWKINGDKLLELYQR